MATPILYQDFSLNFAPVPGNKDISVVQNEAAIIQSLKNLIMTQPYERLHQERIFSNVYSSLFDLATPITGMMIKNSIIEVAKNFEPRAIILNVDVQSKRDLNAFLVSITFMAKTSQKQVTFDQILSRVR